jgi:hypothetical protein
VGGLDILVHNYLNTFPVMDKNSSLKGPGVLLLVKIYSAGSKNSTCIFVKSPPPEYKEITRSVSAAPSGYPQPIFARLNMNSTTLTCSECNFLGSSCEKVNFTLCTNSLFLDMLSLCLLGSVTCCVTYPKMVSRVFSAISTNL